MTKSPAKSSKSRSKGRKLRKASASRRSSKTKTAILLGLLSKPEGASIDALARAADWQVHSVRGFLAGHVRKKLGHEISSEKDTDGTRRYRVVQA